MGARQPERHQGFPARRGIHLGQTCAHPVRTRLPRARGSTAGAHRKSPTPRHYPARTGIHRTSPTSDARRFGLPRGHGEPPVDLPAFASPPIGCPARTGIHQNGSRAPRRGSRLPRTHGDPPHATDPDRSGIVHRTGNRRAEMNGAARVRPGRYTTSVLNQFNGRGNQREDSPGNRRMDRADILPRAVLGVEAGHASRTSKALRAADRGYLRGESPRLPRARRAGPSRATR